MSQPVVFSDVLNQPLGLAIRVAEPLGSPVAEVACHEHETQDGLSAGVWVCSPGRWRRKVMQREFSHFVEGHCFFIPDNGSAIEIRAGDAVLFPENCAGTWDVKQTIRKSFLIL
ncbi:hypothetical protein PS631_02138 [Pseudomonas fluorescens]|uniref:(S)-ureidoglycine aminohydrolase cupin domain-containing protein n=1 Tax=Pseudomonas fluorescens TaxID=294 RepID=A0A5E6S9B4_PSEFL|nr:cupin domain-containing protein [Pseudomonas fluorescens]VVM77336.1 hypothetical protein PS631_02138 [Pseudomonas fluorescens]